MGVVNIDKDAVEIYGAFKEALRSKTVVCGVKNSIISLPFNTLDVVDRIFGKDVQTVAGRYSAACICLIRIVCHLLCEDCMVLEILLNADNVNTAVVEHFAHDFLSLGNNLAVRVKSRRDGKSRNIRGNNRKLVRCVIFRKSYCSDAEHKSENKQGRNDDFNMLFHRYLPPI